MRQIRSAAAVVVGMVLASGLVGGCGSQRPLHVVKSDGEEALRGGDFAKAATDFREYLDRKPNDPQARYMLGRSLIGIGQPTPAITELTVALDVDPLNDDYLDALAEAKYQAGERESLTAFLARTTSERQRSRDYLRQGIFAQRLGNADEAQQALLTAAKIDGGKDTRYQLALASFYGSVGDRQRQIRRVRMAYAINPADEEVLRQIRDLGEVPGPSFALTPEEAR